MQIYLAGWYKTDIADALFNKTKFTTMEGL